jgi:hypothetical protein
MQVRTPTMTLDRNRTGRDLGSPANRVEPAESEDLPWIDSLLRLRGEARSSGSSASGHLSALDGSPVSSLHFEAKEMFHGRFRSSRSRSVVAGPLRHPRRRQPLGLGYGISGHPPQRRPVAVRLQQDRQCHHQGLHRCRRHDRDRLAAHPRCGGRAYRPDRRSAQPSRRQVACAAHRGQSRTRWSWR